MLHVASDFTQLALHSLAHLPLPGPERLLDPAYLAWSSASLPEDARGPIERDAELLARQCGGTSRGMLLQAAPELFEDIAQLRASARLDLVELSAADVAAPALLASYRSSAIDTVELWRAAVALAAPAFAAAWHEDLLPRCTDALEAVRGPLEDARRLHPALSDARVEFAWPLGPRGRAFARRIVVGVPGDWGGLAPEVPAVVALHEAAVRAHGRRLEGDSQDRYVRAEWAALVDVCERIGRAPRPLRDAHAEWLGALALEPLCREAAERGLVSEEAAAHVADRPLERAALLSR